MRLTCKQHITLRLKVQLSYGRLFLHYCSCCSSFGFCTGVRSFRSPKLGSETTSPLPSIAQQSALVSNDPDVGEIVLSVERTSTARGDIESQQSHKQGAEAKSTAGDNARKYASHISGKGSTTTLPAGYDDLVEFSVSGPTRAPVRSRVSFEVGIALFTSNRGGALLKDGLRETVVTELKRGSNIALVFESNGLVLDSWLSVVTWEGRPIAPPFSATAPAVEKPTEFKNTVHIIVGNTPIAAIDFETLIDPSMKEGVSLVRLASRAFRPGQLQSDASELVVDQQGSVALRYRSAFMSYARSDFERVSYFAQGIDTAGTKVHADVMSFRLGETWHAQAEQLISDCDVFYLCWSSAASQSKAVAREVNYAMGLATTRKRPKIIPLFIDDQVIQLPVGLEEHNALTQWSRIRAGTVGRP